MSSFKEGDIVPVDQLGQARTAHVVDIRDVIAERSAALLKPVRALERMATANAGLPGRLEALEFCAAVERMFESYERFVTVDAASAERELIDQMNLIEAARVAGAH